MAKREASQAHYPSFTYGDWQILTGLLDLLCRIDSDVNQKANFVIGTSGLLLVFSLSQLNLGSNLSDLAQGSNIGWLVIAASMLTALAISVFAIRPTLKSHEDRLNLYWPGSYLKRLTRDEYAAKIREMLQSEDAIIDELSQEVYDYAKVDVMPRVRRIRLAAGTLVIGLILGVAAILAAYLR